MLKPIRASIWMIVLCCMSQCLAEDTVNWPQWRGPEFKGSVPSGDYPIKWSDQEGLAWKVELPGRGSSTPVVWNEQIILTTAMGRQNGVMNLDLNGDIRWQTALGQEESGKHRTASGCNPSPVTDGETIFVYYKSGDFAALDFDGNVLWKTNLQDFFGDDKLWWDVGTSPVLTDQYVIGTVMHTGESGMVAFHKRTGKVAWEIQRNYETPTENSDSYTTPLVVGQGDDQLLLVWGADHVTAHLAKTGQMVWFSGNFNPDRTQNWPSVASPVVVGDILVISYGRGSLLAGIRLGGKGDVTESHRLWTREGSKGFVPTPAVYEGRVYLLGDRGEILCIDPENGKTLWSDRLPKHRGKYYASPVVAGNRLYLTREDGTVFVTTANGAATVLSENPLNEQVIASPVPVSGKILIRGQKHLFCVDSR